jgi:Uma2 family endonuclease
MISVAAYLENEKVADLKSEYVAGRCRPVTGASHLHDLLCMRLVRLLNAHLEDSSCRVFRPTVKVHVRLPGDERFYYPDLQVACDAPCGQPDYLDRPRLILEVLCAANERPIREEKAPAYRTIDSLEELVLADSERSRIQVWYRTAEGWIAREATGEEPVRLGSIGLTLSPSRLFAREPPFGT